MKRVFLASEVRSGSTYAAELISYTMHDWHKVETWGLMKEHFSSLSDKSVAKDIRTIYENIWENSHGFRCSKIMCAALSIINRESQKNLGVRELFFGKDSLWIIIRRKNLISQAVSLAFARNDGIFHAYDDNIDSQSGVNVGMSDVDCAVKSLAVSDAYLDALPIVLSKCRTWFYEDIINSPREFVVDIVKFTGLEVLEQEISSAKLRPTSKNDKAEAEVHFKRWLLQNFHETLT